MALVPVGNGSGWWYTVTLVDNGNDKSTKTYELRAATEVIAQAAALAINAALVGTSGSTISNTSLSYREEEDAFSYPASGVENQNIARIVGQLTGSTKKATMDIPAALAAIFVDTTGPNANVVDLTVGAVIAYLALFEAGNEAFISDGETLDFGVEGRRVSARKGFRG